MTAYDYAPQPDDPVGGKPILFRPETFRRHADAVDRVEEENRARYPRAERGRTTKPIAGAWGLLASGHSVTAGSGTTLGTGTVKLCDRSGTVKTPEESATVYNCGTEITASGSDRVLPLEWTAGDWSVCGQTSSPCRCVSCGSTGTIDGHTLTYDPNLDSLLGGGWKTEVFMASGSQRILYASCHPNPEVPDFETCCATLAGGGDIPVQYYVFCRDNPSNLSRNDGTFDVWLWTPTIVKEDLQNFTPPTGSGYVWKCDGSDICRGIYGSGCATPATAPNFVFNQVNSIPATCDSGFISGTATFSDDFTSATFTDPYRVHPPFTSATFSFPVHCPECSDCSAPTVLTDSNGTHAIVDLGGGVLGCVYNVTKSNVARVSLVDSECFCAIETHAVQVKYTVTCQNSFRLGAPEYKVVRSWRVVYCGDIDFAFHYLPSDQVSFTGCNDFFFPSYVLDDQSSVTAVITSCTPLVWSGLPLGSSYTSDPVVGSVALSS